MRFTTFSKHILYFAILSLVWIFCAITEGANNNQRKTEGIDSQWLKTLISIEVAPNNNSARPIGSGFLVKTPKDHILLVTAKHVIIKTEGQAKENLIYRINDKKGNSCLLSDMNISRIAGAWFFSEKYDVACRFMAFSNQHDIKAISSDYFLPSDHVRPGAPVLILGFPMGLRSEEHSSPIIRKGIVSQADGNILLIDAAIFPGNSGGPVIYSPTIIVGGGLEVPTINKQLIIGLISQVINYTETAISLQTYKPRITFEENAGLAIVIPAEIISTLIQRDDVKYFDNQLSSQQFK